MQLKITIDKEEKNSYCMSEIKITKYKVGFLFFKDSNNKFLLH